MKHETSAHCASHRALRKNEAGVSKTGLPLGGIREPAVPMVGTAKSLRSGR